jgi:hypothetical protein
VNIIEERLRTIERDWRLLHEQNEQLIELARQAETTVHAMGDALRAVLLFHDGRYWTDEVAKEWKRLTGSDHASSVVLCQRAREALGVEPRASGAQQVAAADPAK